MVGNGAWERANDPHFRDRASFIPNLQKLLRESGRLELVDGEDAEEVLGEGYRFHLSEGHTPGLLLTEIPMSSGPVVFAGDLMPGAPWVHLPVTMGYDRFPELLIEEKRQLLTDLEARKGRLFFTHDHGVAMASIQSDERGRFSVKETMTALSRWRG